MWWGPSIALALLLLAIVFATNPKRCYFFLISLLDDVHKLLSPPHVPKLYQDPKSSNVVRFVCISDTHNLAHKLSIPPGDVLVHAGDFTLNGSLDEIEAFNEWLGTLPHKHKIVVPGNHDVLFDESFYHRHWQRFHRERQDPRVARGLITNATLLINQSTLVDGISIYGWPYQMKSPGQPMAFNLDASSEESQIAHQRIQRCDVLVSHGPPRGHGDRVALGFHVGSEKLASVVRAIRPRFHIFGHIHEDMGVTTDTHTTYINASSCNLRYNAVNEPIVFDFHPRDVRERPRDMRTSGPSPSLRNAGPAHKRTAVTTRPKRFTFASGRSERERQLAQRKREMIEAARRAFHEKSTSSPIDGGD